MSLAHGLLLLQIYTLPSLPQEESNPLSSGSELGSGEEEEEREEGELGRELDFSEGEDNSMSRVDSTDDF